MVTLGTNLADKQEINKGSGCTWLIHLVLFVIGT